MTAAPPPMFQMPTISKRLGDLTTKQFDVLIVGSGYGGSIAASSLARAGKAVCLLERGREILPGAYPTDLGGARDELQLVTARQGRLDPDKNAMLEVRVNDNVHVILGNGLGGGSLVNAGVSIVPDMRVFLKGWPKAYAPKAAADGSGKAALTNILSDFYSQMKLELGANQLPQSIDLNKLSALEQSGAAMKQDFERAEINVTFQNGKNYFGFTQSACNLCGDCCSGCNYGAKNTLLMNYLPDAAAHGAVIVTQAEVDTIVTAGSGWIVNAFDRTKPLSNQKPVELQADMVVLAAGSLGSTEILNRSVRVANGPTLSKALGSKFSANGDVLAFGFGANVPASGKPQQGQNPSQTPAPTPLYSIGAGVNAPTSAPYQPGPCITGIIRVDMNDDSPLEHGLVIEDGTAPGPFAAIYPPLLFMQDVLTANPFSYPDSATRLDALKILGTGLQSGSDPAALSYSGVMTQMQSYLLMSHDDASGKLVFDDATNFVKVIWEGAGSHFPYPRDNHKLAEAAEGIWADFIANPVWQTGFGRNVVSVHPLGGCPMSDSDADGVTDAMCRVYKGDGKNSVYENLLVCDGSVVPTSLGVNPLLTISAITTLAMDQLLGTREGKPPQIAPTVPVTGKSDADAAQDSGMSWPDIAAALALASGYAINAEVACGSTEANAANAIGVFCSKLFPSYFSPTWTAFINDFTKAAATGNHLADIGQGFGTIASSLAQLGLATRGPAPGQQFLQTFFKVVGDVAPSLCFSETMQGHVSDRRVSQNRAISDPYAIAEGIGKAVDRALEASFSVRTKALAARDANGNLIPNVLGAELGGTVLLTDAGGKTTYQVTNGTFDLFKPDPDQVETWTMNYDCLLTPAGASDPAWRMRGRKYLCSQPGSFWWTDLTTLFVDLEPVAAPEAGQALQGIIRLDLQDLAAQALSFATDFNAIPLDQLKQTAIGAAKKGTFNAAVSNGTLLQDAFRVLLQFTIGRTENTWPVEFADGLAKFYAAGIAGLFGTLVLRTYGGFISYMEDFPSQSDATVKAMPGPGDRVAGSTCVQTFVPSQAEPQICLYHFAPPNPNKPSQGPILLAPGMSTTARSFALLTNAPEPSLVERLLLENYDVWLFDSRLSPPVIPPDGPQKIQTGYTLDDVAAEDWPLAVDYVLANSPITKGKTGQSVQILAHCVGALTAQMALLGGRVPTSSVRQLVLMQFTVHPASNWFNVVKSEIGLAHDFAHGFPPPFVDLIHAGLGDGADWTALEPVLTKGIPSINPRSPSPGSPAYQIPLDQIHNTVDWNAPFGIDEICLSPTCHRIYGLYGPVIAHKNVNQATHEAMRQIFGEIATEPFEQLGLIMRRGRAVSSDGLDIYLPNYKTLDLPIHIISGDINQIVLPESGFFTQQWLKDMMPQSAAKFTRTQIKGYAHNDCIIGKDANADVFDGIMLVLDQYGFPTG